MFEHGFPPYWSTIKKLIWLVGTGIVGGVTEIWKTVTGTLIHITDALEAPMRKCEVSLEPIQDLHGQDAPYPAGGGVNKFGGVYNVRFTFLTPIPSGTTITVSTANGSDNTRVNFGNDSDSRFYNGGINTLNSGLNRKYRVVTLAQEATSVYFDVFDAGDYQIEIGDTPTTYKPYSNICPITGWTGREVTRAGQNIFDADNLEEVTVPISGSDANRWGKEFNKAGTYAIKAYGSGSSCYLYARIKDSGGTWGNEIYVVAGTSSSPRMATITEGSTLYVFNALAQNKTASVNLFNSWQFQVAYSDTQPDNYEPYSGTTLSVTFPDTVYGGKYDFVSGNGNDAYLSYLFDGINTLVNVVSAGWIGTEKTRCYLGRQPMPELNVYGQPIYAKSNCAIYSNNLSDGEMSFVLQKSGDYCEINIYSLNSLTGVTQSDTPNEAKAKINAYFAEHPMQIVYKVAEPTEYSRTPQPISTLKGENNVWGDGNIEMTYKAQAE